MFLGLPLLPERVAATDLPVIRIHGEHPSGLWLREDGQKYPRPLERLSEIPQDWQGFRHAEITLPDHPVLQKGLELWDTPGINSMNPLHRTHLNSFLADRTHRYRLVLYFINGSLTSTQLQFLKNLPLPWNRLLLVLNMKKDQTAEECALLCAGVQKMVIMETGTIHVHLLAIASLCDRFHDASAETRSELDDSELVKMWKRSRVDITQLLEINDNAVMGLDLFDLIDTIANEEGSEAACINEYPEPVTRQGDHAVTHIGHHNYDQPTIRQAQDGDTAAQFQMGLRLMSRNPAQAVFWLTQAAASGNPFAQFFLGVCYSEGIGVKKNTAEASVLYDRADRGSTEYVVLESLAAQGDVSAQFAKGMCYEYGYHWKKSWSDARHWYKLAADAGHPDAKRRLVQKV
jgi:hypothetical protein